jgi:hypothetical protein
MIETMTLPAQIPRPVSTKLRTKAIPAAGKVRRRRNIMSAHETIMDYEEDFVCLADDTSSRQIVNL